MAKNKIIYGDETLIDLTNDTVSPNNLLLGETAHDRSGESIQGSLVVANNRRSFYGTCTDSASTVAKTVTLTNTDGWELVPGTTVSVKFSNSNTAQGVTLDVNGTGAKKIWYSQSCYTDTTGTSTIVYGTANRIITYVYDGTYWSWLSHGADNNTTYSTMAANEVYTGTETTAKLARADRLKTDINKLIDDKVNELDVTVSGASASKTLSALSEADGKISANFQNIQISESQVTNLTTDLGNKVAKAGDTMSGALALSYASSATMTYASTNPQIQFADNGSQGVKIIYSNYDSYRPPYGLKIVGDGGNYAGAWLEVEGDLYAKDLNATYYNIHPENADGGIIPFITNDLAYLTYKGGSYTVKSTTATNYTTDTISGTTLTTSFANAFDGAPTYVSFNRPQNEIDVIEITCHKTFTYSNTFYIDFGAVNWRAKDIRVLVRNSDTETTWTQKGSVTGLAVAHWRCKFSHSSTSGGSTVQGFNQIRIVLTNYQGDNNCRVAQIGLIQYSSAGAKETLISRGGCAGIYGSLIPQTNSNIDLGSSSKKWKNGYFTNINGQAVGSSPKFTDTTYTAASENIGSASKGTNISADDITAWTTNTPTVVTKKTVVTGGSTTDIPNISKKTVVTGVTKKTVVTSASGATASYSGGILTITDGSFSTGDSVTVTTGDSVTVGTAIKAYTTLTTGDSVSVTAGTAASLSYTPRSIPNISVTTKSVVTGITAD